MDKIDLYFYKIFNEDLKSLNNKQLEEHFRNHGIKENRMYNVSMANDFFKKINFDPDFYIKTKKLNFPMNKYRSTFSYLEYLKSKDFKNRSEFEKYLNEILDLDFIKIYHNKSNLNEIYDLHSSGILKFDKKKFDDYLKCKKKKIWKDDSDEVNCLKKDIMELEKSNAKKINNLKLELELKEKEKEDIYKNYLTQLNIEKYKLKLEYDEKFFFFNKIEKNESIKIFKNYLNLIEESSIEFQYDVFKNMNLNLDNNERKSNIETSLNKFIFKVILGKKNIFKLYFSDKEKDEYFEEGISNIKKLINFYLKENLHIFFKETFNLALDKKYNFNDIDDEKLLLMDFDFISNFFNISKVEDAIKSLKDKYIIINKYDFEKRISEQTFELDFYKKRYDINERYCLDTYLSYDKEIPSFYNLQNGFSLVDIDLNINLNIEGFCIEKNSIEEDKLKNYIEQASNIYCDKNLEFYFKNKKEGSFLNFIVKNENKKDIKVDMIDFLYVEELEKDEYIDFLPNCKYYNNFYKFNKLKKDSECEFSLGLINFTPVSSEPLKAIELFKSMYMKTNKYKLYFLGDKPEDYYTISSNKQQVTYYQDFYFQVNKYPQNIFIENTTKLESWLPKIGNILIFGNNWEAEKMFKYAVGSGCIPFNYSQNKNLIDIEYYNIFFRWSLNLSNKIKKIKLNEDKLLNFPEFIKEKKITEIHISKSLIHLQERILKNFKLTKYCNNKSKALFFGLYAKEDFELINAHRGEKFVMPGGSDLPNIKKVKYDTIISVSRNVSERLFKLGFENTLINFSLVDKNIFKPVKKIGHKIYVYDGIKEKKDNQQIYNTNLVDTIEKLLPQYEFIRSSKLNKNNKDMAQIYSRCFLGLRLTHSDGNANTVQEFEEMKLPIIHNQSDYGIKWKNINDIVKNINNFSPKNAKLHLYKKIKRNIFNIKKKKILIVVDFILDLVAGNTIMVKNYLNKFNENFNSVTLLTKYDAGDIFLRDLTCDTSIINFKNINQINLDTYDIILSRVSFDITEILNDDYLSRTIIYGLDSNIDNIIKLDNKFLYLMTQSKKLKEYFIKNKVLEEKIMIQEPFAVKYNFDLPEKTKNQLKLIYCGTLRDEENILEMIDEFTKIHKEKPEITLSIIWGKIKGDSNFTNKINSHIKNGVKGVTFKHKLSHKEACYEIATSDMGICWRKKGWGDNGELSTKIKEYEMYEIKVLTNNFDLDLNTETLFFKDSFINILMNYNEKYLVKDIFNILYLANTSLPKISGYTIRTKNILNVINKEHNILCMVKPDYYKRKKDCIYNIEDKIYYHHKDLKTYYSFIDDYLKRSNKVKIIWSASNYYNGNISGNLGSKHKITSIYELRGFWHYTRKYKEEREGNFDLNFFNNYDLKEKNSCLINDFVLCENKIISNICHLKYKVPKNNLRILSNGAENFQVKNVNLNEKQKLIFGYIGSVLSYEGVENLVKIFKDLIKQKYDIELIIVGGGSTQDASETIETLKSLIKNETKIKYLGSVEHKDIKKYYDMIDIICLPRIDCDVCNIVAPLKPYEAMRYGKLILASSVNAISDIIKHNYNGILFEKTNINDLKNKIINIIEKKFDLDKIINNGFEYCKTHTWDNTCKDALDIINNNIS